ncbi:hypothetical protein LTR62_002427 [Meristemomyces frigidus]|uniref:DUF6594 domain-containing protein n=1 Tax=Meristemomyces frigidus TaxID=1508187 RepID=A0AAN7TG28_9PEZI|nr:hypothetical protein LTR62_002427 [Meristemomyces frigidus]
MSTSPPNDRWDADPEHYGAGRRPRYSNSIDTISISGKRLSRTRSHSRNFSRPAQTEGIDMTELHRRRSSDDLSALRASNYWDERLPENRTPVSLHAARSSPNMNRSRFSGNSSIASSARPAPPPPIPVFAKRAVEPRMLKEPGSVALPSPAPTYASRMPRSSDVIDAYARMSATPNGWGSVHSLASVIQRKAKSESSTFAQRVFEAGKPDLLYDLTSAIHFKHVTDGVLDLTTLQRMSQHVLQQKLVEQVKALGDKGAWMEIGIRETLHQYCESVRDLEYMERTGLRGAESDPFLMSTSKPMDCKLLEEVGLAWQDPKRRTPETRPDRLGFTRRTGPATQMARRLLLSCLGCVALLAPFLIMKLIPGGLVRIISTCVFALAFAVGIVLVSDLEPDRLCLVTAAYAAALVIFVGTDPPTFVYG